VAVPCGCGGLGSFAGVLFKEGGGTKVYFNRKNHKKWGLFLIVLVSIAFLVPMGNVASAAGGSQTGDASDTAFYLDPASSTVDIGDSVEFKAMLKGIEGIFDVTGDAEWSVTDSSIAEISNGLATALEAGETVVQAVYNGSFASAVLKVNSSGSDSGSGSMPADYIEVSMAVVGKGGELLFGPTSFMVNSANEWGLTVLGALDASGADYEVGFWEDWGYYVDSIQGLGSDSSGGWMYAVNGKAATVMAEKCGLDENDKIVFYWASTMEDQPPQWSDLEEAQRIAAGDISVSTEELNKLEDSELDAALRGAASAQQIMLVVDDSQIALGIDRDQLARIRDTGKPLAVTIQEMQFVLSPDSLKVSEINTANVSQLQLKAEKLSDWEIQNQITPFTGKLKLASDIYELDITVVDKDGNQQEIQRLPECTVVIKVPKGFQEAAEAGTIAAYWYNEADKKWEYMGGEYDADSRTVSFKIKHFSKYALLAVTGSFDDIFGHWAQKEIEFMAANGFVNGVSEDEYLPDALVTRAEFVALLTRMAGLTAKTEGARVFSDVSNDAWYRNAVDIAVSNDLVKGIDENSFSPQGLITREQMATMIQRLMAAKNIDVNTSDADAGRVLGDFSDRAAVSPWARIPVAFMIQTGLMKGRADDSFVPQGNSTRAEAAVVLYRVLQKLL